MSSVLGLLGFCLFLLLLTTTQRFFVVRCALFCIFTGRAATRSSHHNCKHGAAPRFS